MNQLPQPLRGSTSLLFVTEAGLGFGSPPLTTSFQPGGCRAYLGGSTGASSCGGRAETPLLANVPLGTRRVPPPAPCTWVTSGSSSAGHKVLTHLPDRETEAHICLFLASRTTQPELCYPPQDGQGEDGWGKDGWDEDGWDAWDGGAKSHPSMGLSWGLWAAPGFAERARGSTVEGWAAMPHCAKDSKGSHAAPGKMPPWHQSQALHAPCLSFPTGDSADMESRSDTQHSSAATGSALPLA